MNNQQLTMNNERLIIVNCKLLIVNYLESLTIPSSHLMILDGYFKMRL